MMADKATELQNDPRRTRLFLARFIQYIFSLEIHRGISEFPKAWATKHHPPKACILAWELHKARTLTDPKPALRKKETDYNLAWLFYLFFYYYYWRFYRLHFPRSLKCSGWWPNLVHFARRLCFARLSLKTNYYRCASSRDITQSWLQLILVLIFNMVTSSVLVSANRSNNDLYCSCKKNCHYSRSVSSPRSNIRKYVISTISSLRRSNNSNLSY